MKALGITAIFLGLAIPAKATKLDDVMPIIQAKCAVCHKGPYLDFTKYPFFSDTFHTEQELMDEVRYRLTESEKPMPPLNGVPLTPQEMALLVHWIDSGMPGK